RTYAEMIADGIPVRYKGVCNTADLVVSNNTDTCQGNPSPACNYILSMVEVEVDMETFKPKVLSLKAVSDVGKVGNLLAVEGQAYGGFSHALGFALSEDYSDSKKHSSLLGAGIPQIKDVPDDMEFFFHQGERESGPHGSSGCAEGFQSAGHVAIINAINNAIGVRIYEIPARPEKFRAVYERQKNGQKLHPAHYDFSAGMYELFDYIAENPHK
ncbi:MAG: molybdopterin-dependent oxidoreductase, partial [Firmicutes bacterium]|nr:molybdopterin-dependent oxidoreductase [Bacillota bacterium]